MNDLKVLTEFLNIPLGKSEKVFERFSEIPNTIVRGKGLESFLYLRGKRENKVLLVAHADTCWEKKEIEHKALVKDGKIYSSNKSYGLGADDRAGCTILWLLKESGHSILITNGEESHRKGSNWLMNKNKDIADEINSEHQFMIQLDRCNGSDFKCYSVGTDKFREYLIKMTGYREPNRRSFTDIVTLCRDITGVNLSIGYYEEHTSNEWLSIKEWQNTLSLCRRWLSEKELPRFRRITIWKTR